MLILIFCWLKPIFGENCLRTAQVANMAHSSLGRFSPLPRHRLMLDVVTKKRPWLAKYVWPVFGWEFLAKFWASLYIKKTLRSSSGRKKEWAFFGVAVELGLELVEGPNVDGVLHSFFHLINSKRSKTGRSCAGLQKHPGGGRFLPRKIWWYLNENQATWRIMSSNGQIPLHGYVTE